MNAINTSPMIAFCTTCKGRTQHLMETLPRNIADNLNYQNLKFIILDYRSEYDDNLVPYMKKHHRGKMLDGKVVLYRFTEQGPFQMAHAKNMAHRCGILENAKILVNIDADNFTGEDFANFVADKFREDNIFLWARMIKEGPDRLPRGISGRIAVSSNAFINSGGYDEKFSTWAPDDKDFNLRLRRLGYQAHEINNKYLDGVLHNDKLRFREYPHAQDESNAEEFEAVIYSETTIANFGNYGRGTVYKNFEETPILLDSIPTRIFGIGMHKTATGSLHAALKMLGFDSAHWKSAHWAKAIWMEMNTFGRSQTLEKSYALCDLPITILYEKLDKAYPGSKFILTIRNEEKWIESVMKHWSHEYNQFRSAWDTDPFTHMIHKELYGQRGFNAEIFLAKYKNHNADVLEYFKSRPDDLLVMNMDGGAGWQQLCPFLGKEIPAVDYPREYVKGGIETN